MKQKSGRRLLLFICLFFITGWILIFLFFPHHLLSPTTTVIEDITHTFFEPDSCEVTTRTDSIFTSEDSLTGISDDIMSNSGGYTNTSKTSSTNSSAHSPQNEAIEAFQHMVDASHTIIPKSELPKNGKSLTVSDFHLDYTLNTRWRLTNFFNAFEDGDYLTGTELSKIFKKDPTVKKLTKAAVASFIENNIDRLTRVNNALVVHTKNPNGIHTKIKIPFIEDVRIDIANGSAVYIGQTFLSNETLFRKSFLMPVAIKDINILHNGEPFPNKGYISGDYYFIDYAQTKTAFKIR